MSNQHLSAENLVQLIDGRSSPDELPQLEREHFASCRSCSKLVQLLQAERDRVQAATAKIDVNVIRERLSRIKTSARHDDPAT